MSNLLLWSDGTANQIDARTRYEKGEWFLEVSRGHLKGKWHVADTSGSNPPNPPPKKKSKAENVSFYIPCIKLFWAISNTRGSACWQKGQQQERSGKKDGRRARSSRYWLIYLFILTPGRRVGGHNCSLHCRRRDVNPFFLDKIHDISARWNRRDTGTSMCPWAKRNWYGIRSYWSL